MEPGAGHYGAGCCVLHTSRATVGLLFADTLKPARRGRVSGTNLRPLQRNITLNDTRGFLIVHALSVQ